MYLDGQSSHIPAAMVSASSFGPIEGLLKVKPLKTQTMILLYSNENT
jgi:hypothetical protein